VSPIVGNMIIKDYLSFFNFRISLGLGGYGIQFGLQALTGSLFINVFLLGMVSSPLQFVVIWAQNRYYNH